MSQSYEDRARITAELAEAQLSLANGGRRTDQAVLVEAAKAYAAIGLVWAQLDATQLRVTG